MQPHVITVEVDVQAHIDEVWQKFNDPEHVVNWNFASDDWHCPKAANNFKEGGKFNYEMAAKDGSFSFDFWGYYTKIIENQLVEYTLGDGRNVSILFTESDKGVNIKETFEPESENTLALQEQGWQAILNNFKKYVARK